MRLALVFCSFLAGWFVAGLVTGAEPAQSALDQLQSATQHASDDEFLLRYKFEKGEQVRAKVVHLVTVETKIKGTTQTAKTRSVSTKLWDISDVDAAGNITLVYSIEHVDMWQQVTGRQEIRYDSSTGHSPPDEYKEVAKSVGVPLATIKMDPSGKVIERTEERQSPGAGSQVTVPLPEGPVKVGAKWTTPIELPVKLSDGLAKVIKARQAYELIKVETGVATIAVRTEILTPVNDPKVKVQLVQQLTNGKIRFDIDAGRVLWQQLDLDETVIGFNGADSMMQYLGRYTEDLDRDVAATARRIEQNTINSAGTKAPGGDSTPAAAGGEEKTADKNTADNTATTSPDDKPAVRR